jgi:hypothetical protein
MSFRNGGIFVFTFFSFYGHPLLSLERTVRLHGEVSTEGWSGKVKIDPSPRRLCLRESLDAC